MRGRGQVRDDDRNRGEGRKKKVGKKCMLSDLKI